MAPHRLGLATMPATGVGHVTAFRLPAEERSAVAAALMHSLETGEKGSVAEAWRSERLCRRAELRAWVVRATIWSEVRARMNAM